MNDPTPQLDRRIDHMWARPEAAEAQVGPRLKFPNCRLSDLPLESACGCHVCWPGCPAAPRHEILLDFFFFRFASDHFRLVTDWNVDAREVSCCCGLPRSALPSAACSVQLCAVQGNWPADLSVPCIDVGLSRLAVGRIRAGMPAAAPTMLHTAAAGACCCWAESARHLTCRASLLTLWPSCWRESNYHKTGVRAGKGG